MVMVMADGDGNLGLGASLRKRGWYDTYALGASGHVLPKETTTIRFLHPPPYTFSIEGSAESNDMPSQPGQAQYLDNSGALSASQYSYCNSCSYDFGSILMTRRVASARFTSSGECRT